MNRNTESHFSLSPHVDISRSRFDRSASLKTSFNAGDVVPFFLEEVLPRRYVQRRYVQGCPYADFAHPL